MNRDDLVDAVIITALAEERTAVLRYLHSVEEPPLRRDGFHRARLDSEAGTYQLIVVSPGAGNVPAAAAATRAIDVWNPQHIFLVGIAGGVKGKSRRLGDVIVAEQIVGYEPAAETGRGTIRRFEVFRPAHQLLEAARHLPPTEWIPRLPRPDGTFRSPGLHFGVVASGEKVIRSTDFIRSLVSPWSRLAAVEMESFGVALAAYRAPTLPGVLMIKAISDWADARKNDRWHKYAADVAASFLTALLRRGPFASRAKAPAKRQTPFNGRNKIGLCRRLGDSWQDLADYFDIPLHERARFQQGRECQGIWEWLELRDKLDGLLDALKYIGRDDLLDVVIENP